MRESINKHDSIRLKAQRNCGVCVIVTICWSKEDVQHEMVMAENVLVIKPGIIFLWAIQFVLIAS